MLEKFHLTFQKPTRTIFVHTDATYNIQGEEALDLILSPAFYWCKKERVGVKSGTAAKKIAHSVFDGTIPAGEYKYFVHKTEETGEFLFFAYDEDRIVEQLTQLEIPLARIHSIRFAQSEFTDLQTPLKATEKAALILTDGIVSIMPIRFLGETETMDLGALRLSRHKINIRTYNSLGFKAARIHTVSALFFLFALLFMIEKHRYATALEYENERATSMLKEASLPTTTFQLESIKKNLLKRADEAKELQGFMQSVATIGQGKEIYVETMRIDDKSLKVTYTAKDSKSVQARIKQYYPKAKVSQSGEKITMEVAR